MNGLETIIAALRATPMHPHDDLQTRSRSAPPPSSGFYAWWQTPGALPGVPATPHPNQPVELLYVGIAPRDDYSKSNLRKRLSKHHHGAIGASTFRFDLTAFLWRREHWEPYWTDRPVLPPEQLADLEHWQRRHLSVQWITTPRPWKDERLVVHGMQPPLNRDHNEDHPFYDAVGKAPDCLRAEARRGPR